MPPPNLLFVFSDQHRWSDLGCYGNDEVQTPTFDAFAKDSIRFSHCISNSPLCVPARGTLLTGLYPLKHGAITNDLPIRQDVTSLGHVLANAGYKTGYIGKWHLAGVPREQFIPSGPGRLGFDFWKVSNCTHTYFNTSYYDEDDQCHAVPDYEPQAQTDLACSFIRENGSTPWALVMSWGPPHDPYREVPDEFLEIYDPESLTLRDNVAFPALVSQEVQLSEPELRSNLQGYYAHITALDQQFARLLKAVEESGQKDNTIIVYTSDHGDMLGSQRLTNKQLPYDESVRVPLLARWPGVTRKGSTDQLISTVDLPVSIAGLMGLSFPEDTDGRDLSPLFSERGAKGREECYIFDYIPAHQASNRGGEAWRGIRTREFTLVREADGSDTLLFDNRIDPFQLTNRINDPDLASVQSVLSERLTALIEKHDRLLPGDEFVQYFNLTEAWNLSQEYFGYPLI